MKSITVFLLALMAGIVYSQSADNKLVVNCDLGKTKISKHVYGHFSEHLGRCIYEGIWVGENSSIPNTRGIRNDVVKALKEISVPNMRWPGGCFADTYHWKDGIGPRENRKKIVNIHWGGVTEDNGFGTHEFLDFCEQVGCEPVICGNVGSGTVQEFSEWVEYINSSAESPMTDLRKKNGREKPWNVKFWAVGNENWGCGGNMTPEQYADDMRQYSTYIYNYSRDFQNYKIACGPNSADYNWMEVLMKNPLNQRMFSGISIHQYFVGNTWGKKGSATQFGEPEWYNNLANCNWVADLLDKHITVMDKYDPERKKGLIFDEWGNWFEQEPGSTPGFLYQQNTLRDAVAAGMVLNIFNNRAERIKMANIAQVINVLQSMILTKNEKIVLTPTYYVFKMYKVHHDATLLPLNLTCNEIKFNPITNHTKLPYLSASASKDANGLIHITITNNSAAEKQNLSIDLRGFLKQLTTVRAEIITAEKINDFNDFDQTEKVNIKEFKAIKAKSNSVMIEIPSKSVVMLELK